MPPTQQTRHKRTPDVPLGLALLALSLSLFRVSGPRPALAGSTVCLNELAPRVCSVYPQDTRMAASQTFIELYNRGPEAVDVSGWALEGASTRHVIMAGTTLRSGEYLVAKDLVFPLEGKVILRDANGAQVDFKDYHNPSCGRSVGRYPDGGAKWLDDLIPSPGGPNILATATAPAATHTPSRMPTATPRPGPSATARATTTTTPAATASATVTKGPTHLTTPATSPAKTASVTSAPDTPIPHPTTRLCLSEFLPAPQNVDWDGNGVADYADEWIELYNPGTEEVDLRGWQLDDRAGGGSNRYEFPIGEHLGTGSYGVYYQRRTGLALNNSGDDVRLVDPSGREVDRFTYTRTAPDASYARRGGCTGAWAMDQVPSPGEANPSPPGLYLPLISKEWLPRSS